MMRSLDFTVCTRDCVAKCFRKLTEEEQQWAKKHYPYQSYAAFTECKDYKSADNDSDEYDDVGAVK